MKTGVSRILRPSVRKILVEGVDELAAPVSNKRTGISEPFVVAQEQVAGSLGRPGTSWVGGDAREVHRAGSDRCR